MQLLAETQEHEFFKVDFQTHRGFLKKKTRDNITLTSVKVVPLTVTSMQTEYQQKILQFGCATAQKLLTVRCVHALFDGKRSVVFEL